MHQVQNQMTVFSFWESVFMYTRPLCRRQLGFNAIIVQHHFIISGNSLFCGMVETRTVSFFRMIRPSGIQLHIANSGHQQDVSQIGMSRAAKMGVTETDNGLVPILVTGTIFISIFLISPIHIMRNCICVRTQLHPSERSTSTGKGMPHPVGTDYRIHIVHWLLRYGGQSCRRHSHHQYFLFHIIHICLLCITRE